MTVVTYQDTAFHTVETGHPAAAEGIHLGPGTAGTPDLNVTQKRKTVTFEMILNAAYGALDLNTPLKLP